MNKTSALAVLEDALERCRREEMRTAEVYGTLDFLEVCAFRKWPFDHFRDALENSTSEEGRRQVLNASVNGIRLALMPTSVNPPEANIKHREWVFEPAPHLNQLIVPLRPECNERVPEDLALFVPTSWGRNDGTGQTSRDARGAYGIKSRYGRCCN